MGEQFRMWSAAVVGLLATAVPAAVFAGSGNPVVGISIGHPTGSPGDIVQVSVMLNLLTTPPAAEAPQCQRRYDRNIGHFVTHVQALRGG